MKKVVTKKNASQSPKIEIKSSQRVIDHESVKNKILDVHNANARCTARKDRDQLKFKLQGIINKVFDDYIINIRSMYPPNYEHRESFLANKVEEDEEVYDLEIKIKRLKTEIEILTKARRALINQKIKELRKANPPMSKDHYDLLFNFKLNHLKAIYTPGDCVLQTNLHSKESSELGKLIKDELKSQGIEIGPNGFITIPFRVPQFSSFDELIKYKKEKKNKSKSQLTNNTNSHEQTS